MKPKRSDPFQHLMYLIYSELAPQGVTVNESVIDEESGTSREIDILIESSVAGIPIRMAVECRNRSRKATVEWIDGLLGKFESLSVDKVIAVSASGFSHTALVKAQAKGIITKTLEEASSIDWPKEFLQLGILRTSTVPRLHKFYFHLDPKFNGKVGGSLELETEEGPVGIAATFVAFVFESAAVPSLAPFLTKNVTSIFRSVGELSRPIRTEHSFELTSTLFLKSKEGIRHRVKGVSVVVESVTNYEAVGLKHRRFEQALVSTGKVTHPQGSRLIHLIQLADKQSIKLVAIPGDD